ncbi:SDR family NAD(P)-dependent oxidoreductase [Neiella marina]|uniref:SDR family NAD(P)-dependent oxidoreductase n=1 Tax=Neiella holothuriorum TaxID=2870530 RepID=A0ABS7EHF6_9GAMM|nr:SDR family NAD(P)-dependent oxidoreductase [Neiella holothuriorum]MBW8191772.1 SDR family NAD(P)-dependent oxidoreductase [Neiella holothuriorum]
MLVLITGASGAIGRSLVDYYQARSHQVIAVVRGEDSSQNDDNSMSVTWVENCPPARYRELLSPMFQHQLPDAVFHCCGVLHNERHMPEKALKQFSAEQFVDNFQANCLSSMLLLQALEPFLNRQSKLSIMLLSAKVGSITDNYLGGWYSYRMSKAALNMAIKTVAIEWQRRFPKVVVNSVHPGTTDSALSKPFQLNIPQQKLASSDTTATRLAQLSQSLTPQQSGHLLYWDGSTIPF